MLCVNVVDPYRDRMNSPNPASEVDTGHPDRRKILFVLCFALVVVVVNLSALNVALPSIARGLDASQTAQLWIVAAYALAFACLLLPMGALGDRWGRRKALVTGLGVFVAGSLVSTLADSTEQLISGRAVMGVGAALIMPATLSILTIVFPVHERPGAIAKWAGFAASGAAFGPPAAGLLLERFWWGSVFLMNVPVALGILLAAVTLVPDSRDEDRHPIDRTGAALSTIGLATLIFAIIEGPEMGWASPVVLAAFGVALVALIGFVRWELQADHPMLDPRLFRIPAFAAGATTIAIAYAVMLGMFLILSLYMQLVKGWSPLKAGLATMPFAFVMMFTAPRSPKLVARFGIVKVVAAGQGIQAVAALGLSFLRPDTPYWLFAPAFMLMPLGMGLMMPASTGSIMAAVPAGKAGVGSAVNDTSREVGGAIGIALLGTLLATGYQRAVGSATTNLPEGESSRVVESIVEARRVASEIGGASGEVLVTSAEGAYADGIRIAFLVASVLSMVGAVTVRQLRTRGSDPVATTTSEQQPGRVPRR